MVARIESCRVFCNLKGRRHVIYKIATIKDRVVVGFIDVYTVVKISFCTLFFSQVVAVTKRGTAMTPPELQNQCHKIDVGEEISKLIRRRSLSARKPESDGQSSEPSSSSPFTLGINSIYPIPP
ncbi:hypothetical protein YC2023_065241 [Brassica napus]